MNLNQVTISSTNLKKAVDFYILLGLKLIVDALPRYARFECPEGDATFSIHFNENKQQHNNTIVYFEDKNLEALVFQLKQKGITFISELEHKSWLWAETHLLDPDGNKIILFKAGDNRKNPPWRIN
ncbi:VOC family protein [Psychroserpens sp. NJDZ02]|uniref:VOC family protein n=1 Tax=Psychroserpens sp. NJDZ02 TaxID=2570561 RepID=UPI0010A90592|nr:VOC family protein [Psychroserpens sp. NJDZ02]QCE42039.1 VOC family protein [Psychroserpens sp. NJDZ02]